MECKLLITVGVAIPREQFIASLTQYFNDNVKTQFNEWNYKTLLAGEKDMIKVYARMLANPRYRSALSQRDLKQSLQQSKTNCKDLQELSSPPDYFSKMIERQCTGLPDLNTLKDFFHQVMKLEEPSFGLEMSHNGSFVYITMVSTADKYAQEPSLYTHIIPMAFFVKSECTHVESFCKLLGLNEAAQKPQVIIDHMDGRQLE
jgi:hypothetical protein